MGRRGRTAVALVLGAVIVVATASAAFGGEVYQKQWVGVPLVSSANAVATDAAGNVFISNSGGNTIEKFDPQGALLARWAISGTPWAVNVDAAGTNVYVTNQTNNRVEHYDGNGQFIGQWGVLGSSDGEFNNPHGVAVDSTGNVYVADQNNQRVEKFTGTGTFLTKWDGSSSGSIFGQPEMVAIDASNNVYVGDSAHRVVVFDTIGGFIRQFGTGPGFGDGQFNNGPTGIAIDPVGNVYAMDIGGSRVEEFDSTGAFIRKWGKNGGDGTSGSGNGEFTNGRGVAVDANTGTVYAVDQNTNRVEMFTANGTFLGNLPTGSPSGVFSSPSGITVESTGAVDVVDAATDLVARFDANGAFVKYFTGASLIAPTRAAADSANNVYVVDSGQNRVVKFDSTGALTTPTFGSGPGAGNGQLNTPRGVAVDAGGNVYVADSGNSRIQEFNNLGSFITEWGAAGTGNGAFNNPSDVAIEPSGNVLVADAANNRIQRFTPTGMFLEAFGSAGPGNGHFSAPQAIAVGPLGATYVADTGNSRVQRLGLSGGLIPIAPKRILDTRIGTGAPMAKVGPQQTLNVDVTNTFSSGVPQAGVDAVVLNVTATGATANGWLTAFPAGTSLPNASNLNFLAGQTVPNLVVVKVGHGGANEGKVAINNTGGNVHAGSVNVIADVVGWYADGSDFAANQSAAGFVGTIPTRILDTRNGTGVPGGSHSPVAAQGTFTLDVAGVAPVNHDPSALAVVLNVTATGPTKNGWLTVFPADQALPTASNLNFVAGQTVANLVVVKLGQGGGNAGKVKINNTGGNANAGTVHVVADVVGYYMPTGPSATNLTPFAPQRILDTRNGTGVPGGSHAPVGPNATITVNPQNATGIPPVGAYSGVIVNVTATGPTKQGWLTAYPSDQTVPNASNLNFKAAQTVPNLVKIKVGADGMFKITNTGTPSNPQPSSGTVHVIVDIVGYFQ